MESSRKSNEPAPQHPTQRRRTRSEKRLPSTVDSRAASVNRLVLYLNLALSVENAAIKRLESRIMHTILQDSRAQLYVHFEETMGQQNRLKQLISELNGTPTEEKAKLPGLSPAEYIIENLERRRTNMYVELKAALDDAIVEDVEIVLYEFLLQIAQRARSQNAITVLTDNLDEERSMASWIKANIPILVKQLWTDITTPPILL